MFFGKLLREFVKHSQCRVQMNRDGKYQESIGCKQILNHPDSLGLCLRVVHTNY